MENCSARIVYNKQRISQDGKATLYLRIIIGSKKKDINLKIQWKVDRFDLHSGRCLPLKRNDTEHQDVNLILADAEARATEIFVQYRLLRLDLTLKIFLKEFYSKLDKNDFIAYYENKMYERLRSGEINDESVRTYKVTLNHLKNWKGQLTFAELNNRTAQLFDTYLVRNTTCKSLNA